MAIILTLTPEQADTYHLGWWDARHVEEDMQERAARYPKQEPVVV